MVTAGPPPPPRDPVWNGRDVAVVTVFTIGCLLLASAAAGLVWLIMRMSAGARAPATGSSSVFLLLAAQAVAMAAGMIFTAAWLDSHYHARFWQAIHWRRVSSGHAAAIMVGAVALAIGVQLLSRLIQIPHHLPVDRMFSPQTAWPLAIYGVALAPLFEEFFFRGLLYPSLRRSFAEGMTPAEARRWRPWFWSGAIALALGSLLIIALHRMQAQPVPVQTRWWLLAAVLLGLGAPLWADLLGLIFRLLARLRQPELLAIVITGILFGLMHSSQLASAWGPVLLLVLVGIILTAVRAYTGSLTASWLLHLSYNAVLFGLLYIQTHGYTNFHGLHG